MSMIKKGAMYALANIRIRAYILGLTAVAALVSVGAVYDETTGFVTLKANDSSSIRSLSSAGNWSDGLPPHDNPPTNYYVAANRTVMGPASDVTFPSPLFVAGTIRCCGGWSHNATFSDLRILAGGTLRYHEIGTWAGRITFISEDAENPSFINNTRAANISTGVRLAANVVGSRDSQVRLRSTDGYLTFLSIEAGSNWNEFYGTFRLDDGFGMKVPSGVTISSPGTFEFGGNAWLQISANSEFGNLMFGGDSTITNTAQINVPGELNTGMDMNWQSLNGNSRISTVGTFIIGDGAYFYFTKGTGNPEVFHVTNRLEIGQDVSLTYSVDSTASTGGTPVEYPIFRFSPEAVASGLPDFTKVDISMNSYAGSLPTVVVDVRDDQNVPGGKYAYLTHREVVHYCGKEQFYEENHTMDTDVDQSGAWSDGRFPHPEADYYLGFRTNIAFRAATDDHPNRVTTFTGGKLCMDRASMIYLYTDACISNLHTYSTATIQPRNSCRLSGKWTLHRYPSADNETVAQMLADATFHVDSEICGDGDLVAQSYNPQDTGSALHITAMNTNWTGGITTKWTKNATSPDESETAHTRIVVGDGRNLGGTLSAFRHDSLKLHNYSELRVTNTTEFAEATRGFLILTNGIINVDDGKTASLSAPVTLHGTLIKTGGGTLAFGGPLRFGINDDLEDVTVPEAGYNVIDMRSGALKVTNAKALDGSALEFAIGTSLHLDLRPSEAAMQSSGFLFSGGSTALSCAGRLPVVFDGGSMEDFYSGIDVSLCTVDENDAEAMAAKLLPLIDLGNGMRKGTLSVAENGDGLATINVRFAAKGCRVIIR